MVSRKQVTDKINSYLRQGLNTQNRKRLKAQNPTLLSSNCIGGFVLHDLNQKFNSPFINLYLTAKDFIQYLKHIEYYQHQSLQFITTEKRYPVAKLNDLTIHFMHYHSEQEAKQKWEIRTKRMNLENLFVVMTDRDGCTYQDLIEFDNLPFNHKIVFTHQHYPELKSAFYIAGFEQNGMVGDLFEYTGLSGKRYYDHFDFVDWFNR
ncbi:DUF1919 domain-containing protein [Otariodibacter oris]|uniref:Uncharacterized protein (DUF1919 family) n=1 Tax=Otariodibacter oris TaxID=1032623 RepID=A0A420XHW4_9PAST|nr:DUF1919 domain-containing protein [Otariodibacter oris]QGM80863.1 exopolysaccharide biosynthesis protein [Otariodibacter oris]RKR76964.1 uncharacterized protein (DUF1919 family) [Otariodibacter oris]